MTTKYGSLDNASPEIQDEEQEETARSSRKTKTKLLVIVISLAVLVAAVAIAAADSFFPSKETMPAKTSNESSNSDIHMPSGVNFGSWLSLEDYFYVGSGAVEVATPYNSTQGTCLPPLDTGSPGPSWNSETDLLASLTTTTGSLAKAIRIFHAHRVSFIGTDDLAALQRLGIQHVRVPISWCLTDQDPAKIDDNEDEATLAAKFTCQDPFYKHVQWPAIPRSLIVDFLRKCAAHDISATLDIHTYPGATSIGTFSGLWPLAPRFWINDQPLSDNDIGRTLLSDFIQWLESLSEKDPLAFQGLRALSPMNEPAHLAGMFGPNDDKAFLPDLPHAIAETYLEELNKVDPTTTGSSFASIPDGPHLRVLLWLKDAVTAFRESSLPALGKELHVNIHESIFRAAVLPKGDGKDPGGGHPGATRIIASWWRTATSTEERKTWAVLDMHHYHAWEPACTGTSDGQGNYTCGDAEARADTLRRCTSWATDVFRGAVDEECGPGAQLASAEFSASTHHRVRLACNDIDTLQASYQAQIEAAEKANVELFWWSWKMPYGEAFRPAWSFKHFLYLIGVTSHPDESNYSCGDHVVLKDEPSDDLFLPRKDN